MTTESNQKKSKISSRGGSRPGAGRPKGSRALITVQGLLDSIEDQAGVPYEKLLIEDFIQARITDSHLAHKYHTLLSNKILANLNEITIEEIGDQVDAKKQAFREAILALNINKTEDDEDATD